MRCGWDRCPPLPSVTVETGFSTSAPSRSSASRVQGSSFVVQKQQQLIGTRGAARLEEGGAPALEEEDSTFALGKGNILGTGAP